MGVLESVSSIEVTLFVFLFTVTCNPFVLAKTDLAALLPAPFLLAWFKKRKSGLGQVSKKKGQDKRGMSEYGHRGRSLFV